MKNKIKYYTIFMSITVLTIILMPNMSTEFYALESLFINILKNPSTVTYYTYAVGVIVVVGIFHKIFKKKNEK